MTNKKSIRILRMKALSQKIGYQPSTIYGLIAQGKFPRASKIIPGGRAAGWIEQEIDTWIEKRSTSAEAPTNLNNKFEAKND